MRFHDLVNGITLTERQQRMLEKIDTAGELATPKRMRREVSQDEHVSRKEAAHELRQLEKQGLTFRNYGVINLTDIADRRLDAIERERVAVERTR